MKTEKLAELRGQRLCEAVRQMEVKPTSNHNPCPLARTEITRHVSKIIRGKKKNSDSLTKFISVSL